MVQEAVNTALRWGKENGLTFNASKTVAIHFMRNNHKTPRPLIIKEEAIPYSQEVKYLGVKITQNLDWTPHIKEKADKTRKLIFATQKFVDKTYGIRPSLMRWVWTSIVAPITVSYTHLRAHETG